MKAWQGRVAGLAQKFGIPLAYIAGLCFFPLPGRASESATLLASRGVKAYQEGHYGLAQSFFERSIRDAQLKGLEDQAVMASANLVDVLLEMGQTNKAQQAWMALGQPGKSVAALYFWKAAQIALAQGRAPEALRWLDSALATHPEASWKPGMQLDRLKCRWLVGDTLGLGLELEQNQSDNPKLRPAHLTLSAEMAMAESQFASADQNLELAIKAYRESHRYARAAVLLWKRAACASALGHRENALVLARQALVLANEIGIEPGGMGEVLAGMFGQVDSLAIAKRLRGSDLDAARSYPVDKNQGTELGIGDAQNEAEKRVSLPPIGATGP
jgi:tetratricopeptide (TPR) repeat protein